MAKVHIKIWSIRSDMLSVTSSQGAISNIKTGHIYGPDLVLHQARQTLRELINLTGLYTKVRPYVHLLLNKHGRLNM
jgi:hypothetical protein